MKRFLFVTAIVAICFFSIANTTIAAGTTCTITLNAASGHSYTYTVQFRIWDAWYGVPYTGWSTPPASIATGPTTNFPIPWDVIPDCDDRWVVQAYIVQYYDGYPTGYTGFDSDGPMSSDDYVNGYITLNITI